MGTLNYTREEILNITGSTSLGWQQFLVDILSDKIDKDLPKELVLDIPDLNLIKKYFISNKDSLKCLDYIIKNDIKIKFMGGLKDEKDKQLVENDLKSLGIINFELIIDKKLEKDEYTNIAFYENTDKCYVGYNPSLLVKKVDNIIGGKVDKLELNSLNGFYIMLGVKEDVLGALIAKKMERNIEQIKI